MAAIVLITGATGGLGKALAAACAARGWSLYLTDLATPAGDAALAALATGLQREFGVDVAWRACDLTAPADRDALWEHLAAQGVRLWMLLNVAGLDYQGPFAERPLDELLTVARLHVEAVIANCHRALALRDPAQTLRIVNVASFAAFYPMPGKAVYAATKRCLVDLSRALHVELRPRNVTVTAVCPAGMPTAPRTIAGIEALGLWGRLTATPVNRVARRTVALALRGRPLYVPGLLNRAIRAASALTPLAWRLRWIARRWSRRLTARARPAPEPAATALGRRATPNPPPARDLAGRAIVVTGATAGIGLATADALLARGAHVIAIARSPERCRAAAQALLARWPGSRVDVVVADLSSQAEVRRAAAEVRALLPAGRLDALINNAGAVAAWFTPTIDGYELQFALNHLAAFLLTHELLPLLAAAPAGRVVAVSSRSHRWGRIHWADPMLRQNYDILRAYGQSKLANALFTAELNRRLGPASRVRAFAADPGLVDTAIGLKHSAGLAALVWRLRRRGGQPPDAPARNIVFLATDPAAALARGWYWRDGRPLAPSRRARSADQAARLWALSARLCGLPDDALAR